MAEDKNLGKMFNRKGSDRKGCLLPALLFKAMNDAHISHLMQKDKTLARHNAFSDFYTAVDGQIDTFVETYMGMNSLPNIVVAESSIISDPIAYFNKLYLLVTAEREKLKEGYLLNQVDEMQQLIAHTLYKFKHITT